MNEVTDLGRKGMNLKQFNEFMKRCEDVFLVRYVTPTIHSKFKDIVAITIDTSYETKKFSITNNPDENYDLNSEVNKYLDELDRKEPIGKVNV